MVLNQYLLNLKRRKMLRYRNDEIDQDVVQLNEIIVQ